MSVNHGYYHHDHQGSVVAISDQNRNIVQTYTYDARGNVIASEINHWYDLKLPRNKTGLQNNKLYNGKEYEPELGLYYYRNRYYSPILGKFISQDPLLYGWTKPLYLCKQQSSELCGSVGVGGEESYPRYDGELYKKTD